MAKVIATSNFNLESISDVLILENVDESIAQRKADLHNQTMHENDTYYYKVVPDDYELWDASTLY